jgi:myo-inositol-1(or 4)-monophosphatase
VPKYQDLVGLATGAAERAARLIRDARRPDDPKSWGQKRIRDFVTSVDRDAEQIVTDVLVAGEPGSVVRGEELSPEEQSGRIVWVVDPLDGTTNFLHGYAQYAVSIGAVVDGALAAGVINDVTRGLTYTAAAGAGAWCGDQRLRVSAFTDPATALIGTGFPFRTPELFPRYLRQFTAISNAVAGVRRAGAAALDLVDVAAGRFEGFWELELAPWDVAAGTLIIREAGGVVTDLDGNQDVVRHGPIVAGNAEIQQWLLGVLKG